MQVVTADGAAATIRNGSTVYFGGSGGGHGVAESVIEAIARRYGELRTPRGLTVASSVSLGDFRSQGFNRLADEGLVERVVCGGFNNSPALGRLVAANRVEGFTLPQGVLAQLCRERAAGRLGLVTKVGLGTFVDPRFGGGRQGGDSDAEFVKLINLDGHELLYYPAFRIDVAVIRGTSADEDGNISCEEEAFNAEIFHIAAAARRSGGTVVAQVKYFGRRGTLNPRDVRVPGRLVDYVVLDKDQRQTYETIYDPGYAGKLRLPDVKDGVSAAPPRSWIARRAALELRPNAIVNLGFGVSNEISRIAACEGIAQNLSLTVEQGVFGGVPAGGLDAGAGHNFDLLVCHPDQFDFYDGGGLDIAFLSFAEVDAHGNVNVSRYGKTINGPGGFINISQGARKVVFSGTMTAGRPELSVREDGSLCIDREGSVRKFVRDVQQVTFSGGRALETGQVVLVVTERAVFRLTERGLVLEEIAPGIDVDRDVKEQMGFDCAVADELRSIEPGVFGKGLLGLKAQWGVCQS